MVRLQQSQKFSLIGSLCGSLTLLMPSIPNFLTHQAMNIVALAASEASVHLYFEKRCRRKYWILNRQAMRWRQRILLSR
jgi:hypothetical protein